MYCRNCGTKLEEEVKFCPNCGQSTQEPAGGEGEQKAKKPEPAKAPAQTAISVKHSGFWSVGRLIAGIVSILLFCLIMFQSCVVGAGNTLLGNQDTGGTQGGLTGASYLIAGIVGIATRNSRSKGGPIAAGIIYWMGAVCTVGGSQVYGDLMIWGILAALFGLLFVFCGIRTNGELKDKKTWIAGGVSLIITIALIVLTGGGSSETSTTYEDIGEYLGRANDIAEYLEDNGYEEGTDGQYISPDKQVRVILDAEGFATEAEITGDSTGLFGLHVGETFEITSDFRRLSDHGYNLSDFSDTYVIGATDPANTYIYDSTIQLSLEDGTITDILYQAQKKNGDEAAAEEEFAADDKTGETETENSMASETDSTGQAFQADPDMLAYLFPDSPGEECSWASESGYYMIPYTDAQGPVVLFAVSNSMTEADVVYYATISKTESTEYGGLKATGEMHTNTDDNVWNGTVEIVWESMESIDYPTVTMTNGTELTDTSMTGSYSYYGLVGSDSTQQAAGGSFQPEWLYGSYEIHNGYLDAAAEVGFNSGDGTDYLSLNGSASDGSSAGQFYGIITVNDGRNGQAVDEAGNVIIFYYNGIDSLVITDNNGSALGGATFPGFSGTYQKTADLSMNAS